MEGGKEGGREGGREGGKEGRTEERREGGREGGGGGGGREGETNGCAARVQCPPPHVNVRQAKIAERSVHHSRMGAVAEYGVNVLGCRLDEDAAPAKVPLEDGRVALTSRAHTSAARVQGMQAVRRASVQTCWIPSYAPASTKKPCDHVMNCFKDLSSGSDPATAQHPNVSGWAANSAGESTC
jgi:hypothetical protein